MLPKASKDLDLPMYKQDVFMSSSLSSAFTHVTPGSGCWASAHLNPINDWSGHYPVVLADECRQVEAIKWSVDWAVSCQEEKR